MGGVECGFPSTCHATRSPLTKFEKFEVEEGKEPPYKWRVLSFGNPGMHKTGYYLQEMETLG